MHLPEIQLRRHQAFHSKYLEQDRDVLVWLPPGYEGIERPYERPLPSALYARRAEPVRAGDGVSEGRALAGRRDRH